MQPSRLKLFICEFITGGGLCNDSLPKSLVKEGMVMRDALLKDLAALNSYDLVTTHDTRVIQSKHVQCSIAVGHNFDHVFRETLKLVDIVWLIAPETDGALLTLVEACKAADVLLVGSGVTATKICTDKLLCAEALLEASIPTIQTLTVESFMLDSEADKQNPLKPIVVKPIDGVGCEDIKVFENAMLARDWFKQLAHDGVNYIVQPYQEGQAGSFSMLCNNGHAYLLTCNAQDILIANQSFTLNGITVNGLKDQWDEMEVLAQGIAQVLPDLMGYIGVDIIIDAHGKITVIEINPRLTTSYVAMTEVTGHNVAGLVLDLISNKTFTMPAIERKTSTIAL